MNELDKPFMPVGSWETAKVKAQPTIQQQEQKIRNAEKLKKQQEKNRQKAGM
jgi:hypothetical protein